MADLSSFQHNFNTPFGVGVKRGLYPALGGVEQVGYNADVSTSFETVWDGSNNYTYPASAVTMTATSAAGATDNDVEVTIVGLNADYAEITETVTLAGSGTATTTNSFLRINGAYVSNGQNPTANITIANGGTTYSQITFPYNKAFAAVYTVPAGKRGYLMYASVSLEKQKEVVAKFMTKQPGGVFLTGGIIGTTGSYQRDWVFPPVLQPKTDIEIRAKAGATTSMSASLQILLENI